MPKPNRMTPEAREVIDQFLRDITALKCGIIGLVYCAEPEPAMTILRNRPGSPVAQAESMLAIIKSAEHDGRITEEPVQPLN
jgi:hypothetical protein